MNCLSKYVKLRHLCVLYIFRYEQNFEGFPVIGDDLVITFDENKHVANAFGSAEMLNEKRDGRPCDVTGKMSKEDAIQKAKDEDRKNNGKGNTDKMKADTDVTELMFKLWANL